MITRVVYNNKNFKVLNDYSFSFSNNEVTFNDITIDFTNATLLDIPYKYQEIKIIQAENEEKLNEGKVLFTGFLDYIKPSKMKMQKENREMTLTLLSPLKLATKRCVSLIGTHLLTETIKRIIQPLIDDGFVLKEFNITEGQITTNFVLETVEYCMNNIGTKRNIFWFIDESKNIYINSIDYLFGLPSKKIINQEIKEEGLLGIQPQIQSTDYANIINFKNVRLIYSSNSDENSSIAENYPIVSINKNIKNGDTIAFDNPIIIDEAYLRNFLEENPDNTDFQIFNMYLSIRLRNGQYKDYQIYIDNDKDSYTYGQYKIEGNMSFSDNSGDEAEIVLQRDSFFQNLITGFKWNYEDEGTIVAIKSNTALRYTSMRFMYSAEIEKLKGIISESGQVENTINFEERWTTLNQLISFARSLMTQNSNEINQVELEYDIDPNLKIGDIVEINASNFLIEGKFAVKEISYTFENEIQQNWKIKLKNSDLISSYIDLFRPAETEESVDNINTVILSEFIEENINEKHEIEVIT